MTFINLSVETYLFYVKLIQKTVAVPISWYVSQRYYQQKRLKAA